jgi:uncharacterized protein
MTIQEQITKDMVQSMKEKNIEKTSLLRVVMGEFGRTGKEISDDDAIKIIRKMSENATELNNDFEVKVLEVYLPQMLGENQIKVIVAGLINKHGFSGMKDMGKVMQEIKKLPASSQIDGKIASSIVKQLLNE